jgi:uncharacterized protein with von Willebrand factor type A (vWA) domain
MASNPQEIPEDWLKAIAEKFLTRRGDGKDQGAGQWDEIMETLKKRLEEQQKRHEGGNKWIGTGGTSPFGNNGYNPEGVRIGGESKHKRALKVWEKREFQNLDNTKELGTRNIKIALRRLRRFAREGSADELDIDAHHRWHRAAGLARHPDAARNGATRSRCCCSSMSADRWTRSSSCVEELFSAATSEFKNLEFFYFHNCLYEGVWKDNKPPLFRTHADDGTCCTNSRMIIKSSSSAMRR